MPASWPGDMHHRAPPCTTPRTVQFMAPRAKCHISRREPDVPCPHSLAHLYLIAWHFIITDFYQLHYDNDKTKLRARVEGHDGAPPP
eukprot:scaffold3837_cov110-Isochrysis_galbana.AAC.1